MSKAKSIKLFTLISMLIVSLMCALFAFTPEAYAAAPSASGMFKYEVSVGTKVSNVSFTDGKAVLPLKETEKVAFKNQLVVDDFMLEFEVPVDVVDEFNVNVPMSSFIVTGNKTADGKFVETVENEINFKVTDAGFDVTLNGQTASVAKGTNANKIVLKLSVNDDNILTANVNGTDVDAATQDEYKVKTSDKIVSTVSFEMIDLADGTTESAISVVSVDTKASDTMDNFVQTFVVNESNSNGLEKSARPRFVVNEAFVNETGTVPAGVDADGVVTVGEEYTVAVTAYSVLGNTVTTRIKAESADVIVTGTSNKNVKFTKSGLYEISIVNNTDESIVYETLSLYAAKEDKNGEGEAPVYTADDTAIESFKNKLNDALFTDENKDTYIGLGSNQYLNLPSMESLVSDNVTAYKNLTYTIYYTTPDNSSSASSSFKIPVPTAGEYSFYVVFKDKAGNAMQANDFISTDSQDPNQVSMGKYGKYVFTFKVFDNAPLEVDGRPQGTAYVGVEYIATNFKVVASENTKSYKLFYAPEYTVDGVGDKHYDWKEVIIPSKATDPDASYNGLSYADVNAIDYDGKITFTPHKTGFFKIECIVSSSSSARGESAESIIEVKSASSVDPVKFPSNVNVPQIIFLSVGGLCLAGIIALLFAKPKTKKED